MIFTFSTTNGDAAPVSPKKPEEKEADQFDGVNVQSEKLSHPTANRAKPPQRRPPSGQSAATQVSFMAEIYLDLSLSKQPHFPNVILK